MMRRRLAWLFAASWLGVAGAAESGPGLDGDGMAVLSRYLGDPVAMRRATVALGRGGTAGWPTPMILVLADAQIRSAHRAAARGALRTVLQRNESVEWNGWAQFGLGWMALAAGRLAEARATFTALADAGWNRDVGLVMSGLVDAADGRPEAALAVLGPAASRADLVPQLREVAQLGVAYAHLWAGEPTAAGAAFRQALAYYPSGPLRDDAEFGLAATLVRTGDRDAAKVRLEELAGATPAGLSPPPGVRSVFALRPATVLRPSVKRYRRMGIVPPHEQVVALVDLDGAALARAGLRELGVPTPVAERTPARDHETPAARVDTSSPAPAVAAPAVPSATRTGSPPPARGSVVFPWRPVVVAIVLLAALVVGALVRQLRSGGAAEGPR